MNFKKIGKNFLYTLSAQAISILVNFILNIIVPKFISEYQYAYWQTFVLYLTYVGVLHFGLLDGMVLRFSQYNYDELDTKSFRSQFYSLLIITSVCALALILLSVSFSNAVSKKIAILVAAGIVTKNIYTYNAYAFQLTNRIKLYAALTITQRTLYGGIVVILLWLKVNNWVLFCIADLLGDMVGIVCCFSLNRRICLGSPLPVHEGLAETLASIKAGSKLLIANWSSMFLVGGAKIIIQWNWNELIFGKVSFAFSMTTLFLTFINAISIVLFPSLKRMPIEELPILYRKIRNILSPLLIIIMFLYFPAVWLLSRWLPLYSESLVYFGILLPSVIYTSKVNLLTSNYMKVYRMETNMLVVNFVTIILALVSYFLCAYIWDNLMLLLICVVIMIMVRSIVSEIIVVKKHNDCVMIELIMETLVTAAFMYCASISNLAIGMLLYFFVVFSYFLLMIMYKKVAIKHENNDM